jgi:(R,R)-butanediol dehydrogenase/meso-butanediol dehydrogenase/diacetyl reductase
MVTSKIYIDDIVTKGFEELVNNKDQHIKILVTPHKDKV